MVGAYREPSPDLYAPSVFNVSGRNNSFVEVLQILQSSVCCRFDPTQSGYGCGTPVVVVMPSSWMPLSASASSNGPAFSLPSGIVGTARGRL